MQMLDYQREAQRTKSEQFHIARPPAGMRQQAFQDAFHAAMGLATEGGEILDAFKKTVFYGKPLDVTNLIEEAGDVLWYVAILAEALGTTVEEIARRNNAKLRFRYPERFGTQEALFRDLHAERAVLEQGTPVPPVLDTGARDIGQSGSPEIRDE